MDAETRAVLAECRTIVATVVEDVVIRSRYADRELLARITALLARANVEWFASGSAWDAHVNGQFLRAGPGYGGFFWSIGGVGTPYFEGLKATLTEAKAAAEAAAGVK